MNSLVNVSEEILSSGGVAVDLSRHIVSLDGRELVFTLNSAAEGICVASEARLFASS